jgi:FkbM family methyltransferase
MKFKDNSSKEAATKHLENMLREVHYSYPPITGRLPLAIDIGANLGAFSITYCRNFTKIIAIEPNLDTLRAFNYTLTENGIDNVHLYNYAVGNTCGTTKLYRGGGEQISGNASTACQVGEYEEVPAIDFQGVMNLAGNNYIDYMKIDCEGAEYDFLQGQDLSNIYCITGEYHGSNIQQQNKLWSHLKKTHDITLVQEKNIFACRKKG